MKSRQYNTGRFPAPAICTRALKRIMKKYGRPGIIVTDRLRANSAADRAGLRAGLPRPLSQLRPFDGQFRGPGHEWGQKGVLAASHNVADNRLCPISPSRPGALGARAMNAVTSRLGHRDAPLPARRRGSDARVPFIAAVLPESAAAARDMVEAVDRLDAHVCTWPSCSRAGARPSVSAARRARL